MVCRICLRGSCSQSFHSLEEQESYGEALDAYDEADEIEEKNKKLIKEFEEAIEDLGDKTEKAYDRAREKRKEIELKLASKEV
jgi:predicted ribosome quality control (RQC) complex YloA/Tae2 family protein